MNAQDFQELIWQQGRELYRDMPWREDTRPYFVLVSELMLQQTQVDRVRVKFKEFIAAFPDIASLADASLGEVLTVWTGLGYNRRAKFLHEAAKKVVTDFNGEIPDTLEELVSLPGVGPNTAGAILAYSFNVPIVFIETNIRTVYFYHFFEGQAVVSDADIKAVASETLDTENPREWYWAMMDYGSFLKKQGAARNDQSKHYKKQAPLAGSVREVRGLIIKVLATKELTTDELRALMPNDDRFEKALKALIDEGLISTTANRLHLMR